MADQQKNKFKNDLQGNNQKKKKFSFYWIYAILAIVFIALNFYNWGGNSMDKIEWDKFVTFLQKKQIEKIVIVNKEKAEIFIKPDALANDTAFSKINKKNGIGSSVNNGPHFYFEISSVESFRKDLFDAENKILTNDTLSKTQEEQEQIIKSFSHITPGTETRRNWASDILGWILLPVILIVVWLVIMRSMGRGTGGSQIFNVGKSKAQLFDKNMSSSITFNDVAGLEEAKVEIMEIVEFLKDPKKYTQLGGKIPKGALLVGPPGTGKTLLAKAVAGEAKVPFFSLSGSDFVEMFVGVGASRVRDLFKTAKEKAPCIVFIDEIDAIGRARGKNPITGANDERENTLNQLLTEMDGFSSNAGVIILAATNRADILDRALLRAGRFDRQIHVELPDLEERKAIFKVHMKPLTLSQDIDVDFLSRQTPGFSGADIANVCNESALIAARKNKKVIEKQDFLDAIDRIVGGLEKRSKIISAEEKKVIAFHEAGHAAISWLVEHAAPLVKVTIIPRGKALGAAWYLPEERQITFTDQMLDEMCAIMGGRASEDVNFGKISTGALNDLERITKQAYAMVMYFGLNERVGNLSYYDSSGQQEYALSKPYSETTAQVIDEEVSKIVESVYRRAKKIIEDNKQNVEALAMLLLEKEVIFREDVEHIFGKRQFKDSHHIEEVARDIESTMRKTRTDQAEKQLQDDETDKKEETGPVPEDDDNSTDDQYLNK
ncbi:MAG TPA: ATP-dependent zinc metalloprotease FtsH [Bacteroidales bacterium]|nr:ATP-dependent zinc metalloprotease FtsH [Bacteroidales bacterium]